jgi:hypothetical protein
MDIVIIVAAWIMFGAFLGLLLWDVIRGKPTRVYAIKKGMNTIVQIFLTIGLLLGVVIAIALTPIVLHFFSSLALVVSGDITIGTLASYYWVILLIVAPILLFGRIVDVTTFSYNRAELQWRDDQKVRVAEADADLRRRIKVFFARFTNKGPRSS